MFRSLTVFALSVWLALTSYSVLASSMPSQRLSKPEQSNLQYLVRSIGSQGRGAVDLSDPRAKAAYFDLLARHDITPKTRPYLFEGFKALTSQDYRKAEKQCALPDTGEGPQNFRDILAATANADFSEVKAEAIDSLVMVAENGHADTPNYVLDTLDVYDGTFDNRLTWAEAEEYVGSAKEGGGPIPTFDPRFNVVHTPWGKNPTKGGAISVIASFFFRTASGARLPCLISDSGLEHFMPASMQLNDPHNVNTKAGSDIVICLNRTNYGGNYNDCDYGPMMSGNNYEAHVKVVVNGSVTYNDPLAPFSHSMGPVPNPDAYVAVVPRNHGGACRLELGPADIASHLSKQGDDTLVFNWGRDSNNQIVNEQAADFGSLCWDVVGNNEKWDFLLDLQTKTLNKAGLPIYRVMSAFITEDPEVPPGVPNVAYLPALVMQFGCIEKGAKVVMKGGAERSIEDIKVGDQVIGEGGAVFNVVKTTKGTDSDFIELTIDASKPALSVTPMHPIAIGSRGATNSSGPVTFVPAKNVAVGDRVFLAGASAPMRISKVERKTSPTVRQVFNLTLQRVDASGTGDSTFYANGILVGDNAMQGRLVAEADAAGAALPKREIAGGERIDYENWLRSHEPAAGKHSQQSTVN